MLCALIMAGGKGTRFWPLSTEKKPKQFLNLIGKESMIQMTVNRVKEIIPIERIFVCTCEMYVDIVKEQLSELPESNIIIEPMSRNTAPCIALSALVIKRKFKDSNMIVLPSDHLIKDEEEFRSIIQKCDVYLNNNNKAIITLGIKPNRAETGYGYIKCTRKLSCNGFLEVEEFVEKPSVTKAEEYLMNDLFLWNSGIFFWSIENILEKMKMYLPNTYEAIKDIESVDDEDVECVIDEKYKYTDNISIDYGILEKAEDIYVVPCSIGWDDIGTWQSIERYKEKDDLNNIVTDNVFLIDSKFNTAINGEKKLVLIGVEGIMTLETDDSIYIVNKQYMNKLKDYQKLFR